MISKINKILTELYEYFPSGNFEFEVTDLHDISYLSRIRVHCKIHDEYSEDLFVNLLHKKVPCMQCTRLMTFDIEEEKQIRKKRTVEELIQEFKKRHGDRFMYHDVPFSFKTMGDKVWIKCIKHNYFFEQTPNNHLKTNICCPKCFEETKNN